MEYVKDYADERLPRGCAHCGGAFDTKDHVPSRVFLDEPFPDDLPTIGACLKCNRGFSQDEEYVACLIECVISGDSDPSIVRRAKIARILRRSPALRARLASAKQDANDGISFQIEEARVRNVVLKLARGHSIYELSQLCDDPPLKVSWAPLQLLDPEQLDDFEAPALNLPGEIGCRGSQRLAIVRTTLRSPDGEETFVDCILNDWVVVQEGRYRYVAIDEGDRIRIKFVISEYLACVVEWER